MNIIRQTLQNDKLLYITVHNTVKQCSVSCVLGTCSERPDNCRGGGVNVEVGVSICGVGRTSASWTVLRAGLKRVELQVQRRRKCSTFSQHQTRHAQLTS